MHWAVRKSNENWGSVFLKHTAEMFVNELRFPSSAHVQRQGFHEDLLTLYGTGGVDCKTALLTLVKDTVIIH